MVTGIDHCRIGSLEKNDRIQIDDTYRSLPHRQLRKDWQLRQMYSMRSLPHRQLRNYFGPG